MYFDTTLQVFSLELMAVEPAEGEENLPHLILAMMTGIGVPTPQGRQVLPVGIYRVPIGRELAIAKGKEMQEMGEALPEPKPESDLAIVHNMDEARRVAEFEEQVRSGAVANE